MRIFDRYIIVKYISTFTVMLMLFIPIGIMIDMAEKIDKFKENDDVMPMGDISLKFKSFNWEVIELKEGNNLKKIIETLKIAKKKTGNGKPIVIIMHTEMGNGVDFMMNTHAWHGKAPNDELLTKALNQNPETIGDY